MRGREFAFLLACVRRFFQPGTPLAPADGLDWEKLTELAERHAVLALFYRTVQEIPEVPDGVLDLLRARTRTNARFDLTLIGELAQLVELLERHEIAVIPLKGPLLGMMLYQNAALRSSSDLDVLVHEKDVVRAKKLLEERGYHLESVLHWHTEDACLRNRDSEMTFCRPDGVRVDLHWRLLARLFPQPFDEREVWSGLRQAPVGDAWAPALPPERLLLFLCAHGMKHWWARLGWICDVARLLQVEPGMDWAMVFGLAGQSRTSRMVVLGLRLAAELLGVKVPPAALPYVAADLRGKRLEEIVRARLREGMAELPSATESARLTRLGFERASYRWRFVWGIFCAPTEAEYRTIQLPPGLHWAYYFLRPARLAVKYARKSVQPRGAG